jgi:hypothetical protein
MPPFTASARKLYEETSAIAAAQDAKLDPISDVESKVRTAMHYLYHAQLLLKEAFPDTSSERVEEAPESVHGIPAESSYLSSFGPNGSRLATADEIDNLRSVLFAEELKGFGIGDVESRHPMHAEALRVADERSPEDRL